MRTLFTAIASALVVGFMLGHWTARHELLFWAGDPTPVARTARLSASALAGGEEHLLPANERRQLENEASPTVAVGGQPPDPVEAGDGPSKTWSELYPHAPPVDPPHIADPYFFGQPTDPEVGRIRAVALEGHITSLREAGVPEAVIQAAVAAFNHRFESARQAFPPAKSR